MVVKDMLLDLGMHSISGAPSVTGDMAMIYAGYLFLGVAIGFFLFALFSVNDLQEKSAQRKLQQRAGAAPQDAGKYRPRFYHAAPKGKLQNVT